MRVLVLAGLLFATHAAAQAPTCAPLPDSLSGWTQARPADAAGLKIGQAYDLTLPPTGQVVLPVAPAKPGGPGTFSGIAAFDVARAGDYQVTAGGPVWIEIARDGAPVASSSHSHGPACTGIRKIVVFSLQPGRHVLEIAGSAEPSVRIMLTRSEP